MATTRREGKKPGTLLRELRQRLKLTTMAMAALVGCTKVSIIHWESGVTRQPSEYYRKRIAELSKGKIPASAWLRGLAVVLSHSPDTARAKKIARRIAAARRAAA